MNDVISIKDVQLLIGGELFNLSGDEVFIGLATEIDKIKGGELFIGYDGDPAKAEEAIVRGCTAVVTKKSERLSNNGNYIYVSEPLEALRKIAYWWRDRFSFKVIAISGDSAEEIASLTARLALKKGRGIFSPAESEDSVADLKTLCSLHSDFEWGICVLNKNDNEAISVWRPDVIVSINKDDLIEREALSIFKQENNICIKDKEVEKNYKIDDVRSDPLFGCSFSFNIDGEELKVDSSMIGAWRVDVIAISLATIKYLYPELNNEKLITTIHRYSVLPGKFNLLLTCRGRVIYDGSDITDNGGDKKLLQIISERKSGERFVVVIQGRGDEVNTARLIFIEKLISLKPAEIILVGEYPQAKDIINKAGVPVLSANSPKVALNMINQLETDCIYISGGIALKTIASELLILEGETVQDVLSLLESDNQ